MKARHAVLFSPAVFQTLAQTAIMSCDSNGYSCKPHCPIEVNICKVISNDHLP